MAFRARVPSLAALLSTGGVDALTATDTLTGAPTVDQATLSTVNALTATDTLTGAPTVDQATVSVVNTLTATDTLTGVPAVDQATVSTINDLTATDTLTGVPAVDQATLVSADTLTATDTLTGAPTVDQIDLIINNTLVSTDTLTGAPTIDQATVSTVNALTATDTLTGAPTIDQATLVSADTLTATDTLMGAPTIDQSDLIGADNLTATDTATGAPVVDQATASTVNHLIATDTLASVVIDPAVVSTVNALTATDTIAGAPVIGQTTLSIILIPIGKVESLIDKRDTFELVRDKVGAILSLETLAQQFLAQQAGKDPDLWKFRVFIERSVPWPFWQNDITDYTPIVCVWYDNDNLQLSNSNQFGRQSYSGSLNIDCYGVGRSRTDGAAGHISGDKDAAMASQRTARLVRNIIMASVYRQLDMAHLGLGVTDRWISSRQSFQPQQDNQQTHHVQGIRLVLDVKYNEHTADITPAQIDILTHSVTITPSGEVIPITSVFMN